MGTLAFLVPSNPSAAAAPVVIKPAASIVVTSIPSRLPADGGTYPSVLVTLVDATKNPSLSDTPTVVYLTSSQENVGTVPSSVTIPAGKGYVLANFTSTLNPGVTTVTASAAGFTSSQVLVDTKIPSGFASHLKVVASPSNVLAAGTGSIVVQVLDATNAPARASSALNVSVTSSASSIAKPVKGFVIIPAGGNMAMVNFTTGYQIGTTIITASASTLSTGQASLQVVGPNPYSLAVSAQPNQVVEGAIGKVVIWITGTVGHPARAPQDIPVTLTSSNLTVASLNQQIVVIPRGQMSVSVTFTAGSKQGSAAITASAQGLQSGFSTVSVFKASLKPAGLRIFFEPDPVLADTSVYSSVTVGIVNATGYPAVAAAAVLVNLTSATTAVGTVGSSVTIPKGGEFVGASFTSTYDVGTTIITASAQNLVSSQVAASTYGPIPAAIELAATSGSLPANGGKYDAIAVTLVDATGNPAVAPNNIVVQLSSSLPSVVSVNSILQIKAGESSLVTAVQTGISPGTANITASSLGYLASFALVTTTIPAPSDLGLYVGPKTTLNSALGSESVLTVQLQDINGLPARASQPTTVTITSSNRTVLKNPIVLSIGPGQDLASIAVSTLGVGLTNLTASSAGLRSSSITLNVLNNPVSIILTPASEIVPANQTSTLTLIATALGQGVANASVRWFASGATVSPDISNTSASGVAYAVLTPLVPGDTKDTQVSQVTAEVTSPVFGTINATTTVVFTPVVLPVQPSLASRIAPYVIPIVVIAVVAVAAVLFIFLRRRRRRKAAAAGETPPEEERPYDELEGGPAPTEGTDDALSLFRGGAAERLAGGLV